LIFRSEKSISPSAKSKNLGFVGQLKMFRAGNYRR